MTEYNEYGEPLGEDGFPDEIHLTDAEWAWLNSDTSEEDTTFAQEWIKKLGAGEP